MRRSLLLLAPLVLAACSSAGWRVFRTDELTVRYPKTWFATKRALTPVTNPRQVLAVASYPLPRGNGGADGCAPKAALDRLPPNGAFVFGWEFSVPSPSGLRPADFPRRPAHFLLAKLTESDCLGRSYMLRFRDAGRFFQIHVALGSHASSSTRTTVLRIVDSFRATP